jgi:hypothetical protein
LADLVGDGAEQTELAAEVVVEHWCGDAGVVEQRLHGGAGIAAAAEQFTAGVEQPATGLVA